MDIIPLPFHLVTKLVAAYGETFLALEIKGQVPFPKPLLGLGFDDVGRCESPNSEFYI